MQRTIFFTVLEIKLFGAKNTRQVLEMSLKRTTRKIQLLWKKMFFIEA